METSRAPWVGIVALALAPACAALSCSAAGSGEPGGAGDDGADDGGAWDGAIDDAGGGDDAGAWDGSVDPSLVAPPDGEEPTGPASAKVIAGSVADALANSCVTASIQGLTMQIIQEAQCLEPSAFQPIPALSNVTFAANTFAYLEAPARDALVAAAKAAPSTKLQVTSMLRTLGQQYLVYEWYLAGRCGIGLAAKPGASNHETGLAFDTPDYAAWKSALSARGFKWYGSGDKVHFDYVGAGAKSWKGLDVKAFQTLWNLNDPGDPIAVDGVWGPQTQARLEKSPAGGFAQVDVCGSSGADAGADAAVDAPNEAAVDAASLLDGAIGTWSCPGSYGLHPMADGQYYATAFGCYTDSSGGTHTDPGDNCIPYCITQAQASLCSGMSGPACEESVNWYAADGARFGCMTRLRVTNPKNGKAAVVVVLDYGPSCTVEKSVSHAVVDLSTPANLHLFGSQQGAVDRALVHVEIVDPATPLGPVP